MANILVECPEYIVSVSLGVISVLKPLEESGKCIVRFRKTADICGEDIAWADILVTVRGCEPLSVRIAREAKKAGRLLVYYLDDDLLNIPKESLARNYYKDPVIRKGIEQLLSISNILWGVNPNIKDKYLPLTTDGRWIQNRLAKEAHTIRAKPTNKILYAGSPDHQVIVREILAPVVKRLCAEYGFAIDFTFIGVDPGLPNLDNVHFIPFIKPYEKYVAFVENGEFSIGLAPGRIDSFFACKYYNKFIEYTSVGVVGVYTKAEPYTQIVEDKVNGILCENTELSWYNAIKLLVDDRQCLKSCAENAQKLLADHFNVRDVTDDFDRQFPELHCFCAPKIMGNRIHLSNGYFLFYLERVKLLWRQEGLRGIPQIIYRTCRVIIKLTGKGVKKLVQIIFSRNLE